MRRLRSPLALVSFVFAIAVITQPTATPLFGTLCLIAIALALLESSIAVDAHNYRALALQASLASIYTFGFVAFAR